MSFVHMILGPGFVFCGFQSFELTTEWPNEVTCPRCKEMIPAGYETYKPMSPRHRPQIGRRPKA